MKTRLSLTLVACVTLLLLGLVLPGLARTPIAPSATSAAASDEFQVLGQVALLNGTAVAVRDHYVYIGTADLHFITVNVADPTHPVIVSDLTLSATVSADARNGSNVRGIAFLGQSAYVVWGLGPLVFSGEQYGGIMRVDLSNPAQPVQRDSAFSPTNALNAISIQNTSAYVCHKGAALEPMQLEGLTRIVGVQCNDLIFAANLAYTVDGSCGRYNNCSGFLNIFDYTDPAHGQQLAHYDFGHDLAPFSLQKKDQYLYLVGGHSSAIPSGIQVMDVSVPSTPTLVSTSYLPSDGDTVNRDTLLWMDHYLIVGTTYGLRAYDVSLPTRLVPVAYQTGPSWYYMQVAGDGQHIYATYNNFFVEGGLLTLDFIPPIPHISGHITDLNGSPVSDVTLTLDTGMIATTNISGTYTFTPPQWLTHTITPTLSGYAFWPPTQTVVVLPPAAEDVNFIRLAQPTWMTVIAGSQRTLEYVDTQGLSTTLDFPSTAFSQTTTIALTPTIATPPFHWGFAQHAFDLVAYQSGVPLNDLAFQAPVTVTIHYSDDDLRFIRDESALALWRWNGHTWIDAADTCAPTSTYQHLVDQNILSVPICQAGRYALFGPTYSVLLPIMAAYRSPTAAY